MVISNSSNNENNPLKKEYKMGEDNFFSLSFYINEARRKIYFYGLFLHTDVETIL